MAPGILNSQEVESDFKSKMLKCSMGFTSYGTFLESLKNYYQVDGTIHLSYNRPQFTPANFPALIFNGCE